MYVKKNENLEYNKACGARFGARRFSKSQRSKKCDIYFGGVNPLRIILFCTEMYVALE
jgi:hypothetical protein